MKWNVSITKTIHQLISSYFGHLFSVSLTLQPQSQNRSLSLVTGLCQGLQRVVTPERDIGFSYL